jgi:signal peptidase
MKADAVVPDAAPPQARAAASVLEQQPAKDKGIWHYLGVSLSAALLLLVIALAAIVIVVPKVAGATPMTVLTSSMKPIDPNDLQIGDVATYQIRSGVPGVITHRIIAINLIASGERSFLFQGDNNSAMDDPVRPAQIQGKLWYSVPLLGWVNNAVNGENKSWITPLIAGLLFAYAGYTVVSAVHGSVKKRREASSVG